MLVLVDINNVAYASYHGLKALKATSPPDRILFGLFKLLADLHERYGMWGLTVFCCFERPPYWRHDVFPDYKRHKIGTEKAQADKKEAKEAVSEAVGVLRDAAGHMPWFTVEAAGYEADDLIAYLRVAYAQSRALIVSNDADLVQLLAIPQTSIWSGGNEVTIKQYDEKYSVPYKENKVEGFLKVPIERRWLFRALCGDKSDEIPGAFSGCGPATAARIVASLNGVPTVNLFDALADLAKYLPGDMKGFARIPAQVRASIKRIRLNTTLMVQPPDREVPDWTKAVQHPLPWESSREWFRSFLARRGFNSLVARISSFDSLARAAGL